MDEPAEDSLPSPWGRHALAPGDTVEIDVGPSLLRLRRRDGEVWLAHAPGEWRPPGRSAGRASPDRGSTGGRAPARPSDEEWARWPVADGFEAVALSPVFPPRPVVAEPEHAFRLLPRAEARVFVRVPLWIRVALASPGGSTLTEVPAVVLSDTWWGDVTAGELCYWLATTARRRVPSEVFAPHLAVCPLRLANRSDGELPVDRFALRVAHLSIFSDEGRFWADETRVRYRGADEGSDVDVAGGRPPEAAGAARVAVPRDHPPARGFRARTFSRLMGLPGLGGV